MGPQSGCNLTFLGEDGKKQWPKSEEFSEKSLLTTPSLGPETRLHTHFCLHTGTTGCGVTAYGSVFMVYHLIIEIYPLVPFSHLQYVKES